MSPKTLIIFFLLAVVWGPSLVLGQSDRIHNTSTRGLATFRDGGGRGAYAPARQFGHYASGITYSAPPRSSSNPLSGRNGFQAPRSNPSRDFRISSGLLNYRARSTRLSGGVPRPTLGSPSRYGNSRRLAIPRRTPPMQRVRPNPSPFASLSSRAYVPQSGSFQTNGRNGSSSHRNAKGLASRDSLGQSKSMSQSKRLSEQQSRPALSAPINRR
jgi:hypothetical protein